MRWSSLLGRSGAFELGTVSFDASLPFRSGFFADMTQNLFHLEKPTEHFVLPFIARRVLRMGLDLLNVQLHLSELSREVFQRLFTRDRHNVAM